MKLEMPIIAVLVAGLFFTVIFTNFISITNMYEEAGEYPIDFNESDYNVRGEGISLKTALSNLSNTEDAVNEIEKSFSELNPNPLSWFSFGQIGWQISKLIFNGVNSFKNILVVTAQITGINSIFSSVAFTIIILVVVVTAVIVILLGRSY